MRKQAGMLLLAGVLTAQCGCLDFLAALDDVPADAYRAGGAYSELFDSWLFPAMDSYYTGAVTDEWVTEDGWIDDDSGYDWYYDDPYYSAGDDEYYDAYAGEGWTDDDGWYYDAEFDEWYFYDEGYDEWYYYDPYYDEWYYYDPLTDEWYYY